MLPLKHREAPERLRPEDPPLSRFSLSLSPNSNLPYSVDGGGDGTHSSPLAWKIPRTEEPGRLQPMGSLGVGHD